MSDLAQVEMGTHFLAPGCFSGDGFVSGCLDLYCKPDESDTDTETEVEASL